jgi:hypothetical protein
MEWLFRHLWVGYPDSHGVLPGHRYKCELMTTQYAILSSPSLPPALSMPTFTRIRTQTLKRPTTDVSPCRSSLYHHRITLATLLPTLIVPGVRLQTLDLARIILVPFTCGLRLRGLSAGTHNTHTHTHTKTTHTHNTPTCTHTHTHTHHTRTTHAPHTHDTYHTHTHPCLRFSSEFRFRSLGSILTRYSPS